MLLGARRADDRSELHSNKGSPGRYSVRSLFCSIDQTAPERRQEDIVENIDCGRPFLELEILGDLIDRPLEAGGIDGPDAVALHFAGGEGLTNQGAQAFEFEIAQSAVHPVDDFIRRAAGLLDGQMRAA